ncbi:MAG: hypothetical protein HY690_11085 [Chloroflexi bacterium]|nr:hypothetical protein [Chloroflexota bacterium]
MAILASDLQRLSFLATAGCFVAVGGIVFVLAADIVAASVVLAFAVAAATALVAAIATPSGATWALGLEYVALVSFGATTFLLFLAFPINRLSVRSGRQSAVGCLVVHAALVLLYGWVLAFNSAAYDAVRNVLFSVLAADLVGASVLAVTALLGASPGQREARRALGLVALGTVAGLAPFCLLSLGPYLLGTGALVPPDIAILSIVLLPASLGGAVLSRQFLGIERLVRRGMLALIVWIGLLALYTVGLDVLERGAAGQSSFLAALLGSTVLSVALIAGTFPLVQAWLRRALERVLFHDVYDYAGTLRQLGGEIVCLSGVETIAQHVLGRLGRTLDLSWAAIALDADAPPPRLHRWGTCPAEVEALASAAEGGRGVQREGTAAQLVPLVTERVAIGRLVLGPKRHDVDLSPEDSALVATLAPLVATALQNALLVRRLEAQVGALEERERALAALSAQLMHVQEEERRRIALDLHDDPLQRAILLARELKDAPQDRYIERCRRAVDEIIDALRAICTDLRPLALDDFGLAAGLEWLVNDVRARSDLAASLVVESTAQAPGGRLPADLEVALYRVAQEALNNCLKHAQATRVMVALSQNGEGIWLKVADNGQGHAAAADANGASSSHLGTLGMRERLKPWEGVLTLEADREGGTAVLAHIQLGGNDGAGR